MGCLFFSAVLFAYPLRTAKENDFDVVLIDTAGRMQDNEPLMRALAKVDFEHFAPDR